MLKGRDLRSPFFILTDQELAAEVNKVRIALSFRRPINASHLRCLEEAARRLGAIERVVVDCGATAGGPLNDNEEQG